VFIALSLIASLFLIERLKIYHKFSFWNFYALAQLVILIIAGIGVFYGGKAERSLSKSLATKFLLTILVISLVIRLYLAFSISAQWDEPTYIDPLELTLQSNRVYYTRGATWVLLYCGFWKLVTLFVNPFLLPYPENLLKWVDNPALFIIPRILSSIFSTLTVFMVYQIGFLVSKSYKVGLFAAFFQGITYSIAWSDACARPESIGITFVLTSLYLILKQTKPIILFVSGAVLGLSFGFRPPYALFFIPFLGFLIYKRNIKTTLLFSLGFSLLVGFDGLLQYFGTGLLLGKPVTYAGYMGGTLSWFIYEIIEWKNVLWGTSGFGYYFFKILWMVGSITLLSLLGWRRNKENLLMLFAVYVYITAFTLVPHKEFRFIAPILPMLNVWSGEGMTTINRISQLLIISIISALNVYIYLFD
jgi:phosphatidylinositol glycan class B